ncbi:MAG: cell division protease FtsH [Candidatus Midichloriaceae bacterium]|jgi:cell division protease FtsH
MKNLKKNIGNNLLKWIGVLFAIVILYNSLEVAGISNQKLIFSDFLSKVSTGEIVEVNIRGNEIEGKLSNGQNFATLAPRMYIQFIDDLRNSHVKINVLPLETPLGSILGFFISWLPILVIVGLWIFFTKNMQGGGGKAMGFGKSKAKLVKDKGKKVTFDAVAGIDEAKEELEEVVEFLKNPKKFSKLGGKIPKGCLLIGSPGTGKTLLARAVAGEAGVPFFTISGSDFVEMFVGVGASRVRDMFAEAKKHSPCIIFIDEIDAVGRHRGAGLGGGNDEREQTLNQLLVEMDGFSDNQGTIVIAATNRPDVLDPALLRPGRFDRQITVPVPDIRGREQILKVHTKEKPIAPGVDLRIIARGTPGFSGADLENLVNEAALAAARADRKVITLVELEHAKDKVMMGAERKSMVMTEEEKKITAYHEGGHALVGSLMPESDPIHKATIIPRGRALGMVMQLPETDRLSYSKQRLKTRLVILMAGRVAEELVFGKDNVTTGASNDFKVATDMARNMMTKWGLSDKIGPITIGEDKGGEVFLGYSMGKEGHISEKLSQIVDEEIDGILRGSYDKAKKLITKHLDKLHKLGEALIQYETLTGDEISDIIAGKKIREYENASGDTENKKPKSSFPTATKPKKKKVASKEKSSPVTQGA